MEHPYLYQPIDDEPKVKVLADADVLLECLINRGRFIEDAERLLTEIEQSQQIEVYVTDKCLKRIQLELGEELGEDAVLYVKKILHNRIIEISTSIRDEARTYCLPDFDSAEEVVCAKNEQLSAIVTLNPKNFDGINDDFLIWSVEELFARLQLNKNLLIQYEQKEPAIFMSGSFSFSTEIRPEEAIEVFIGHGGVGKSYMPFVSGSTIRGILRHRLGCLGLLSSPKRREIINLSWIKQIKIDDFDNWITSDKALLLLINNYRTCESKISNTIYSSKYLHKDLLKLILDKFPKKNENKYYKLPFFYSPHQLQLLQNSRWIWRFKLSLTITLGRNVPNTSATCSTNICKLAPQT
ncbi:hypothetical protein RIVM261_076080 [Rivularia sp. IAM M-261]|nr:hypothetical protein RIVM261_076080 [Rivularia sp. IAM M-261]